MFNIKAAIMAATIDDAEQLEAPIQTSNDLVLSPADYPEGSCSSNIGFKF